ncbi:MAG: idi [Patescibacteria group bacterium]|nr:idi [Patescibacteria group bacterium]
MSGLPHIPYAPELITIVDQADNVIGSMPRQLAREQGQIHRIASVVIRNPQGQILLHQRSANLQDSPLKWAMGAAGHVDADEDYLTAAHRETQEELGLSCLELQFIGKYYYERPKANIMLKRFNSLFLAETTQEPRYNPAEVAQIKWVTPPELKRWLVTKPQDFTRSIPDIMSRFGDQLLYSGPPHSSGYKSTIDL